MRLFSLVFFFVAAPSLLRAQMLPDPDRRSYQTVVDFMETLAATHLGSVRIIDIGTSDTGKPIKVLKIGNTGTEHLVVATHHGNEYGSTEVALAFARDVANNPLADKTVYVLPVLNVYGYEHTNRYEKVDTFNYFDPNRDYPGPCGSEGPWHLKSTRALDTFISQSSIVSTATLHTYFPAVVWPWGNSTDNPSTPYDGIFEMLATAATSHSHYETGFSGEVIYPADGTYEDYVFWQYGIYSLLFELGRSHFPSQSDINEMIRVNVPGLRNMIQAAPHERAADHAFTAQCSRVRAFDPHIE